MLKLPFPPASLSGHNTGHWSKKKDEIAALRLLAHIKTLKAKPTIKPEGDIILHIGFFPPDNRGDRLNFLTRCKPLFDGIADALKVNDKRFVPKLYFYPPQKPGRVEIRFGDAP